jgi:hypothetical protein
VSDPVPRTADPEGDPLPSRRDESNPKASLLVLIDTLIDIDVAYERECKAVSQSSLDALAKSQSLKRLREQHQQRRQPLVQQLAALQEQA